MKMVTSTVFTTEDQGLCTAEGLVLAFYPSPLTGSLQVDLCICSLFESKLNTPEFPALGPTYSPHWGLLHNNPVCPFLSSEIGEGGFSPRTPSLTFLCFFVQPKHGSALLCQQHPQRQ